MSSSERGEIPQQRGSERVRNRSDFSDSLGPVFGSGDGRGVSTSWIKIKNPNCTRMIGRRELFEARRRKLTVTRELRCHSSVVLPLFVAFLVYCALTIVPSNSPVFVRSAGAFAAFRNTGAMVAVIVRLPDAPAKRSVPPIIS
jgi:hypothetical protein